MQTRANLALILQRFHLRIPDDYVLEPFFRFNTRPRGGLPLIVEKRL